MPSYLGPTNLPLLEAEAIGCPVICNDFKGHREMLERGTTIFVKPGDDADLCDAMEVMYSNKARPTPVNNETFNRENCMRSIEAAFLSLNGPRKLFGLNFKQY
jgi:glycosyltransferase involved in cell wall biosynthesis